MKKVRLGLLCLLAGVVLSACEEKIDDPNNRNNPGVVDNPVVDTLSGKIYTETISDINFSMDMVCVQGGTFMMGATSEQGSDACDNEKPVHKVTLSSYYYISKYEVTQAQWKAVMGTTIEQQAASHYDGAPLHGVGDNYPMYYVSWTEAKEFCDKLSQKTGKKYALPTEAQWEFAARGGNKSKGYKYSGSNTIGDVAWYGDNSYDLGLSHPDYGTHAVGTKAPNELGIYDMSGNVWEFCADFYDRYSSDAVTNPTGPSSNEYGYRVLRGGSWYSNEGGRSCRVSTRGFLEHADGRQSRYFGWGFRVVCLP